MNNYRPQCPTCHCGWTPDDGCAYDGNPPCAVALEDELYRQAEYECAKTLLEAWAAQYATYGNYENDIVVAYLIGEVQFFYDWLDAEEVRIWGKA